MNSRDSFEGELAREDVRVRRGAAVRAAGTAGPGASAKSLVDNSFNGARASAAFGAATEAAVNLLGIARKVFGGPDGMADVVVAEDVAGTNNHKGDGLIGDTVEPVRYLRRQRDAKEKAAISSDSKVMANTG
jgi:hypothetical protein